MTSLEGTDASTAYAAVDRETFMRHLEPHHSLEALRSIEAAYKFSKYGHRGQTRDDGVTRYFEHCKSVAWILADEAGLVTDPELIVMALLHDIREDTFILEPWLLERVFGIRVRVGLDALTKRHGEGHEHYLDRLMDCPYWQVHAVKLADRLQNLRSLYAVTAVKRDRKLAETQELYVPRFPAIEANTPPEHRGAIRQLARSIAQRITDGG
jgi:(p)ppGpp synthase/HD superfamily hydrolase